MAGPLCGGLSFLGLRAWRGHTVRASELFAGFRSAFGPLVVAFLLLVLLTSAAVLPGLALLALGIETASKAQNLTPPAAALLGAGLLVTPVLALVPFAFWGFAPTLILERGDRVRDAFRLSRRITSLHPARSLLFAAGCAILLLAGFLLGGVGLLLTAPWVLGARARMHDHLFGPRHAPST